MGVDYQEGSEIAQLSPVALTLANATSILEKWGRGGGHSRPITPPASYDELCSKLDADEVAAVNELLTIDPAKYGIRSPRIADDRPIQDSVPIRNQVYVRDGELVTISPRYLPAPVWRAFQEMQEAMHDDIGEMVLIESGYRSPAHQVLIFLANLVKEGGDIAKVAQRVAFPGYSQHGDPVNTAIDVIDQHGVPDNVEPERFAGTKAYAWMTENAGRYGFVMAYSPDNQEGVMPEPWHWRYMPEHVQK